MTAITFTGANPTVGGSTDTWGGILNTGRTQIKADLDMLNTTPTATVLGRVTAGTGEVERLTTAQATTLINAAVGATQTVAGTKGAVPAPSAGDQHKVLSGAGIFEAGLGRAFGCVITTTNVNGSQPTIAGTRNVASISTLTVAGANSRATLTFTNALPSTAYGVNVTSIGGNLACSYDTKTTTSVIINWDNTGGVATEISVSGFA